MWYIASILSIAQRIYVEIWNTLVISTSKSEYKSCKERPEDVEDDKWMSPRSQQLNEPNAEQDYRKYVNYTHEGRAGFKGLEANFLTIRGWT